MATNYQQGLNDLVSRGRYDTRDDFTVVLQPFFVNAEIPQNGGVPDSSYFAPDCFHLSIKGHTEAAKALWQNMFEPVGNKAQSWDIGGPLYCPTETNPYLCTALNDCLSPSPKRNKCGRSQEL
jgi:phospholipase B1